MLLLKFSIILVCLSLFSFTAESQPLWTICPNTTTFTGKSLFQKNLNLLLSSLPSIATPNHTSYNTTPNNVSHKASYNATPAYSIHNVSTEYVLKDGFIYAKAGLDLTNKVYFLYLCRGDVNASACHECVTGAISNITQLCPNRIDAIIWYDYCLLRYSNNSLSMDTQRKVYMWNTQNISNPDQFNTILGSTMNDAVTEASSSPKRFATKEANFTLFQTLHTLLQCTQDLTSFDCNTCLRQIISDLPSCCDGKKGGRVLTPSCYFRYEIYPFYDQTLTAALEPSSVVLPPPPPPGSVTRPKCKG